MHPNPGGFHRAFAVHVLRVPIPVRAAGLRHPVLGPLFWGAEPMVYTRVKNSRNMAYSLNIARIIRSLVHGLIHSIAYPKPVDNIRQQPPSAHIANDGGVQSCPDNIPGVVGVT